MKASKAIELIENGATVQDNEYFHYYTKASEDAIKHFNDDRIIFKTRKSSGEVISFMDFLTMDCDFIIVKKPKSDIGIEVYKAIFISTILIACGDLGVATSEYEAYIDSIGTDLDLSDPESDAKECMSYWSE